MGAAPPNPLFLLDFELITNFVIIFTILAVKMKSLTFSKAFILTLTILQVFVTGPDPLPTGNTSHQGVNDDTTDANTNQKASDTIDAILTYIDNHALEPDPDEILALPRPAVLTTLNDDDLAYIDEFGDLVRDEDSFHGAVDDNGMVLFTPEYFREVELQANPDEIAAQDAKFRLLAATDKIDKWKRGKRFKDLRKARRRRRFWFFCLAPNS